MTYTFTPRGVCSRRMTVELEDGIIKDVKVEADAAAICRASPGWWWA